MVRLGGFLGGSDESSARVQLARDKARRGTADGAIIAREEGEEEGMMGWFCGSGSGSCSGLDHGPGSFEEI